MLINFNRTFTEKIEQRKVDMIKFFNKFESTTATQVGELFNLSPRRSRELCNTWVADSFLAIENPSNKCRSYKIGERYKLLVTRNLNQNPIQQDQKHDQ